MSTVTFEVGGAGTTVSVQVSFKVSGLRVDWFGKEVALESGSVTFHHRPGAGDLGLYAGHGGGQGRYVRADGTVGERVARVSHLGSRLPVELTDALYDAAVEALVSADETAAHR